MRATRKEINDNEEEGREGEAKKRQRNIKRHRERRRMREINADRSLLLILPDVAIS